MLPYVKVHTSDEADDFDEALCVVCWDKEATMVARACGHLVYCGMCRIKIALVKDASNHNDTELKFSRRKIKKAYDSVTLECPICRRQSKTMHRSKYAGRLYF